MYWSRYWSERYWGLSYWQQASYTGSIASSLDNLTASFEGGGGNTGGYWSTPYWAGQYWNQYWKVGTPGADTGAYWSTQYWHQYWANGYWKTGTPGSATGTISATLDAVTSQIVGATTWTEYVDLSINVSLAWQITAYDAYAGTIAATLANATSAATGTVLPPDSVSGFVNSRTDDATAAISGTHVAPANRTGIVAAALADTTAALVGVASAAGASTGTVSASLGDALSTFTGATTIPEITGSLAVTLDNLQPAITGFVLSGYADVGYIQVSLENIEAAYLGTIVNLPIEPIVDLGVPIENSNAIEIPSNYEICDRTGFKVIAGSLVKQWDGTMVRQRSWEARHPQDFVRGRAEKPRASVRPESPDVFVEDDEPVTAEDL